jgi:hypothetical protein
MVAQMHKVAPHMTNSEVAEALNTTSGFVRSTAHRLGISFAPGKPGRPKAEPEGSNG